MQDYGWTIEYVLSLPYPAFIRVFEMGKRIRSDKAIDGFYTPYLAAKVGKSFSEYLFDSRGSIYLDKPIKVCDDYTDEVLEMANARLLAEIAKRKAKK